MLIPVSNLTNIWDVHPSSVLHVGAHLAEEETEYKKSNWGHITWVEAQPKLIEILKQKLDPVTNSLINASIWNKSGIELELNIASNSQSTSLLEFGTHSVAYPNIKYVETLKVTTSTLGSGLPKDYFPEFINLDIQGVELQALQGLGSRFAKLKWIYCEINSEEVYKNCTLVDELDRFLLQEGFIRIFTKWAPPRTWGDALYARPENYPYSKKVIARIRQEFAYTLVRCKRNALRVFGKLKRI